MDKNAQTVATYNKDAKHYVDKFDKGASYWEKNVNRALDFINIKKPRCLELGVGGGRDAQTILKRAGSYVGIDASKEMINIARKRLPEADFRIADIRELDFKSNSFDIIFGLATFLHTTKDENKILLKKAHEWLSDDGLIFLCLKYGKYGEVLKEDAIGERYFYLYTADDIREIVGNSYKVIDSRNTVHEVDWLEIMLRKQVSREK
ncbi:MAG: class I SAM-dependent methyltransferase [Parcubacteria group bacterium]|nr:class I SAM-dependent methyltransferase [Parcubacteria group bacterium]